MSKGQFYYFLTRQFRNFSFISKSKLIELFFNFRNKKPLKFSGNGSECAIKLLKLLCEILLLLVFLETRKNFSQKYRKLEINEPAKKAGPLKCIDEKKNRSIKVIYDPNYGTRRDKTKIKRPSSSR